MNRLDRYVGKSVLMATLVVILVIVGLLVALALPAAAARNQPTGTELAVGWLARAALASPMQEDGGV